MVNASDSAKQHLLADRHPLQSLLVDGDAETRASERRCPAAPAKSDVLRAERFTNEMAIVGTLQVANVRYARCEMPPRGGQNCRLADLTAELITQTVLLGDLCQAQRRNDPAALRQPDIEEIAGAAFHGPLGINHAA